jgi:adenylosuccinate synthase
MWSYVIVCVPCFCLWCCLSALLLPGNGVVVHIPTLLEEMKDLKEAGIDFEGRLKLSDRAHIVFDFHQQIDGQY